MSKQIQGIEDVPNVKSEQQEIEGKTTAETNPIDQEELNDGEILGDEDDQLCKDSIHLNKIQHQMHQALQ